MLGRGGGGGHGKIKDARLKEKGSGVALDQIAYKSATIEKTRLLLCLPLARSHSASHRGAKPALMTQLKVRGSTPLCAWRPTCSLRI